jgi:hypothetical protein
LSIIFLFFADIFQLTPPSLPLAYPPPPSPIHAAQIRPESAKKNNRPGIAPGQRSFIQFQYFNQNLHRQQKQQKN